MEKIEPILNTDSRENTESEEIKQEIIQALDKVSQTQIFDSKFLEQVVLVAFGENKVYKWQNKTFSEVSDEDFSMQDFMRGRRLDFVGINPRKEFEQHDISSLIDKQFLPFIFFEGRLTYNEFLAHEMAHNLFDRQYIQNRGQYEEKDGITDVSE